MKRTCILSWAALLAVAPSLVLARLPGNLVDNPEPYVVSIPPDSKPDDNKRMENQIKQWVKKNGIEFDLNKDHPQHHDKPHPRDASKIMRQSRGNMFRLPLNGEQLNRFKTDFPQVFIGPDGDFEFPQVAGPEYHEKDNVTIRTWPQDSIIPVIPNPSLVAKEGNHTPVLYFVDSGVQWIVNSNGDIHEQFNSPRISFLNGRVPPSVGDWPDPNAAAPWNTIDEIVPAGTIPYTGTKLNPNKDPLVHGTKVASAAVGCKSTNPSGAFGRVGGTTTVQVQSIRVYPASGSPTALNIADGIYEAIDAHLQRDEYGGARSVLVLACRSTSGFASSVEVALLHAWRMGMIVLCAAGDSSTPYTTNRASPNSLWYTSYGQLPATPQPTSPSRFDVDLASIHPEYWPNPVDDYDNPILPPLVTTDDRCYAILVGGNNADSTHTGSPYTDAWGSASTAKGPDVDIAVPVKGIPCATISSYTSMATSSGTSFSVGIVAGVAAVYLDCNVATKSPRDFRNWLLPLLSAPSATTPFKVDPASTCNGWYYATNPIDCNSWYRLTPYSSYTGGKVPKLLINADTVWQ